MTDKLIPISMAGLAADPDRFAQAFGGSFQRFGFAVVSDHGIDQGLIDRGWAAAKAFFDQPTETKLRYKATEGGARGYTAFGIEIAKDATENDLKEFYHVGRNLPAGHRYADHMPPNIWPDFPPEFREIYSALYAQFDACGAKLLSAIARYLKLDPDFFVEPTIDSNSVLRLLHYPPVSPDAAGIRAGAHGDINLITLLLGAEEAGLQILEPDGSWLPVDVPPGAMAINVGDMLSRMTNNVLPSTIHRVVNPPPERRGVSRYSMPFFHHLASDAVISTLPGCITPDNPDQFPQSITANAFLQQRLREIGLL